MKNGIAVALATSLILTFGFSNAAFAYWTVSMDNNNQTYGIRSGKYSKIDMGLTAKQAQRLAKKLNKIEKKDKKGSDK